MSDKRNDRTTIFVVRGWYYLVIGIMLVVGARYVLRIGEPQISQTQGAEVASMRGFRMLEVIQPLASGDMDVIGVGSDATIGHSIFTAQRMYVRSIGYVPLAPDLLAHATALRDTWCNQPPAFPQDVNPSLLQLRLSCTTYSGRYFYIPETQIPAIIPELIAAAPPLAPPRQHP